MNRITHDCQQGSNEWLQLRAKFFTASELSAAAGQSKYQSRTDLIKQKATGIVPEVDAAKQRLFDAGHAAEAAARPIVEARLGAELYPVTMSCEVDGLPLLASLDGIDMLGDVIWENKLLNASLKDNIQEGKIEPHYAYQIEQQLLVSGAEKCYFTASDGTAEGTFGMWYEPNPELRQEIVSIWMQFAKDVAAYVPTETKEMPKADVTVELPALFVHAKGEITTHNMDEFGKALAAKLAETRAIVLVTDQDFSNAKEAAKKFRETAKAIALSKEQMLEQTETIGEAARKMDAWAEDLNKTALQLEKDVEAKDKTKKENMVLTAKGAHAEHVSALESETAPIRLNLVAPNFAEAIKGKRNYASMQDAVDTMLSSAKVEADATAKDVRGKLAWCKEHAAGHGALFPDLQQIITKPMDDFVLTITSRINKAKADEAARLEQEREKIRAEEQSKAQREAKAEQDRIAAEAIRKLDEDRRAAQAQAAADALAALPKAEVVTNHVEQPLEMVDQPAPTIVKESLSVAQALKLGEINARLGYTVSAEFLASLGFVATTERSAKLYREQDFPAICRKIADHTLALAFRKAA